MLFLLPCLLSRIPRPLSIPLLLLPTHCLQRQPLILFEQSLPLVVFLLQALF